MSEFAEKLTLSINSKDHHLIERAFGREDVGDGESFTIEGASIELVSSNRKLGVGESSTIFVVVINFGLGVTASVLASWIYDKLGRKSSNEILVKEELEIIITKEDIETQIKKRVEKIEKI